MIILCTFHVVIILLVSNYRITRWPHPAYFTNCSFQYTSPLFWNPLPKSIFLLRFLHCDLFLVTHSSSSSSLPSSHLLCLSSTLSLQSENLSFPQMLPTMHFSPPTRLLSWTRTIFQIIFLSVFVVAFVYYFSVLFLISLFD